MEKLTIELIREDALQRLQDLEKLQIIRLVQTETPAKLPSSKMFAGKLPRATAEALRKHVEESRNEWERDI